MKNTIEIRVENYEHETPELLEKFKNLGLQEFDSLYFQYQNIPAGVYHVETDHIFSNQYNTVEGYRIFEKCTRLSIAYQKTQKTNGYYISEGIKKIREYQKRVKLCGYCGAQYIDSDKVYCEKCMDSKYLRESELNLLILKPVLSPLNVDRKIPEGYKEEILSQYHIAQGLGKENREKTIMSKNRKKVKNLIPDAEKKCKQIMESAKKETEAYTWLLDNGFNILDNVIYYDHTDKFVFGWYKPLDNEIKSRLLTKLSEFPFDYEFKEV
jgi:hypothetical protein